MSQRRSTKFPLIRAWLFGTATQTDEDANDAKPVSPGPSYADLARCGSYAELRRRFGSYAEIAETEVLDADR